MDKTYDNFGVLSSTSTLAGIIPSQNPKLDTSVNSPVAPATILSGDLNAELNMTKGHLQSSNFSSKSVGWQLNSDGTSEFNGASEWTYSSKVTWSASSSSQSFSSLPVHDFYRLVINVSNGGSNQLGLDLALNGIASGYNALQISSAGANFFSNISTFHLVSNASSGNNQIIGNVIISGKHVNGAKSIACNVGSSVVGCAIALSGSLTGDSNNLASITLSPVSNAISGQAELWFKDNR